MKKITCPGCGRRMLVAPDRYKRCHRCGAFLGRILCPKPGDRQRLAEQIEKRKTAYRNNMPGSELRALYLRRALMFARELRQIA